MSKIYLYGERKTEAEKFFDIAKDVAKKSLCLRSKCGACIIKDGKILGIGWNSPPNNKKLKKCFKDELPSDFKSDRTCCVHAEERAIIDAISSHGIKMLNGSIIYFIRLDHNDNIIYAENPYCTICSKLVLDVGIKYFALWHKDGICVYNTKFYNELSFGRV